ncbi:hypothetical protein J6590_052492 [Homalodisca vitripennis]|nr:hypothetical protein J6590_052492 [Homalodisca vitripennis]
MRADRDVGSNVIFIPVSRGGPGMSPATQTRGGMQGVYLDTAILCSMSDIVSASQQDKTDLVRRITRILAKHSGGTTLTPTLTPVPSWLSGVGVSLILDIWGRGGDTQ